MNKYSSRLLFEGPLVLLYIKYEFKCALNIYTPATQKLASSLWQTKDPVSHYAPWYPWQLILAFHSFVRLAGSTGSRVIFSYCHYRHGRFIISVICRGVNRGAVWKQIAIIYVNRALFVMSEIQVPKWLSFEKIVITRDRWLRYAYSSALNALMVHSCLSQGR